MSEAAQPRNAANRNQALARALFGELARAGVRHACVCPGSRSAPLAIAAAHTPDLRVWTHVDERSAGFFALGLAKATRAPVALICTSGTAAANFLPAVVEASLARVPLVVLTADRPAELRDWGAMQTIDQARLFGSHARWFAELPAPEPTASLLRNARAVAARAVAVALGSPRGPVHLNVPYREPLEPTPIEGDRAALAAQDDALALEGRGDRAYTNLERPRSAPGAALVRRLAAELRAARRGVLLCGPADADAALAHALARLARVAGWPLLVDAASGVRRGPHVEKAPVLGAHEAVLRAERFAAAHAPELVLRFGPPPTSRATNLWLERHAQAELRLVDADAGFADPTHRAAEILCVDPALLCTALADEIERGGAPSPGAWLADFLVAEERAQRALAEGIARERTLFSPAVARALASALPPSGALFASNSMAIRDLDGFLEPAPAPLRVLANRGANGIDGITSSALGAALGTGAPLACLIGDLAFLHDVGGLVAAKRHRISVSLCGPQRRRRRHLLAPAGRALRPRGVLRGAVRGASRDRPLARQRARRRPTRARFEPGRARARARAGTRLGRPLRGRDPARARSERRPPPRAVERGRDGRRRRGASVSAARVRCGDHVLNVEIAGSGPAVLLLHGFTGSLRTLDGMAGGLRAAGFRTLAVDLLGHGGSDAPREPQDYAIERCADDLARVLDSAGTPRAAVLGYSMGGRAALGFAVAYPQRVRALALIGASAGIAEPAARAARRAADDALADAIEQGGVPAFVERWMANPLFASQARLGEGFLAQARAQRLTNPAHGLAGSLRGMGVGVQPCFEPEIAKLDVPALWLAGAEDEKFRALAADLARRMPRGRAFVIPGAGHAAHLERPDGFLAEVCAFLAASSVDPRDEER